ncbi:MAG: hypothetical protein IPK70_06155 [Flavobacteriales bacterium]|jgi:hypothetical protein|nr:hypothetical protein [Flavobacteriales bacterium]
MATEPQQGLRSSGTVLSGLQIIFMRALQISAIAGRQSIALMGRKRMLLRSLAEVELIAWNEGLP